MDKIIINLPKPFVYTCEMDEDGQPTCDRPATYCITTFESGDTYSKWVCQHCLDERCMTVEDYAEDNLKGFNFGAWYRIEDCD